jgi:photosystem II stability/assembly factor-like uncharacterized protein
MKRILTLTICISIFSLTNAQWTIQYQNLSGQKQFNSICMSDENVGFAVGPKIYTTTNGGVGWENVPENFEEFYSVWSPTPDIGVAVGKNGKVAKTTDGGSTWTGKSSGTSRYLWSVFFSSPNIGWIAGGHYTFGTIILKTTDQGETWQEKYSSNSGLLHDINFVSDEIGFAVGYNSDGAIIVKTTNGGTSWQTLDCGIVECRLATVYFLNENIGWVAGKSGSINSTPKVVLLMTNDGGATWISKISNKYGDIQSIKMSDANNGYAAGLASDNLSGINFVSTDGGNNWIHKTEQTIFFNSLFFLSSATGWATTSASIYKYDNPSSVLENTLFPKHFALHQNYPNPFNPSTKINYSVPRQSNIKIIVFDALGKYITTLVNKEMSIGNYRVEFNASHLSSGIYFYQMRTDEFIQTNKMILLR